MHEAADTVVFAEGKPAKADKGVALRQPWKHAPRCNHPPQSPTLASFLLSAGALFSSVTFPVYQTV